MALNSYDDNLLRKQRDDIAIKYDIMKVYCIKYLGLPKKCLVLLWERGEKTEYNDVLDYLSKVYKCIVGVVKNGNGYNFNVYINEKNKPVTAFIDKQKLEKTQLNDVVKLLEKELDKEIVRSFKV